jgi:hypothetical protein
MTLPRPPKTLGIIPRPCTKEEEGRNWDHVRRILGSIINSDVDGDVYNIWGRLIIRFKLTANLETGGSAAAVRRYWNGSAYADSTVITVHDWWGTSQGGRGMFQGVAGMEGWCVSRSTDPEFPGTNYDIVWMEQYARFVEFELTSSLSSGSAGATVTRSWEQGVEPGATVTVHDESNLFPRALPGAKGYAVRDEYENGDTPATPHYRVIHCQQQAITAYAILSQEMCSFGPAAIADFIVTSFSPFNQDPDPIPTTAQNIHGHKGMPNDQVTLQWDEQSADWIIVDVDKKSEEVTLELSQSGSFLERRYVKSAIEYCEDPEVEYLQVGGSSSLTRFKLTADLATGGSAAAVIRTWNGAAYVDGDAITVYDWWSVSNAGRGMWHAISGMEGWCSLRENSSTEYDIVWMEMYAQAIEFQLTEDMDGDTPGSAEATWSDAWKQGVAPPQYVIVYDNNDRFTDSLSGAYGTAVRDEYEDPNNPGDPFYRVVSCQRCVVFGTGTLQNQMCGDEVPITIEQAGWVRFGDHVQDPPALVAGDITNPFLHLGEAGDEILIMRTTNTIPFKWIVVDVTQKTVEFVLDVVFDGGCWKKIKGVVGGIEYCESPAGDSEDIVCGDECPQPE